MPTGYTAGIIDGTIKDFKSFGLLCARNFGATMHMRDEDFEAEYKPTEPSDYHPKKIADAEALLANCKSASDEDLIADETKSLTESLEYYNKSRIEAIVNDMKLRSMLIDAQTFVPPTRDHEGIKKFMIQQLESTIDFDCRTDYMDKKFLEIELKLSNLNATTIRSERIAQAHKDLAYHTENYNKEVVRCATANQWVIDLENSL